MARRLVRKKILAYALLLATTIAVAACVWYWQRLPAQQIGTAFTKVHNELARPLGALNITWQPRTDECKSILKGVSKTGPSTYAIRCQASQEATAQIATSADIQNLKNAATPLGDALTTNGWQRQLVGYDATTWMNMLAAKAQNSASAHDLQLAYRKQVSPRITCEFAMIASDTTAGKVVYIVMRCEDEW